MKGIGSFQRLRFSGVKRLQMRAIYFQFYNMVAKYLDILEVGYTIVKLFLVKLYLSNSVGLEFKR